MILGDVNEIVQRIHQEAENNDDFFLLLQGIERIIPQANDPIDRVRNVLYFLRSVEGNIRDKLIDSGGITMDILWEEGQSTGNYSRYLKEAERRQSAVRNLD